MMRHHAYSEKLEASFKKEYELSRWQCWMMLQPHIDSKKGGINKPSDLIGFAWEQQKLTGSKPELSAEEMQEVIGKMDQAIFTDSTDSFDELVGVGKKQEIFKK
jgi:hypothetical protein